MMLLILCVASAGSRAIDREPPAKTELMEVLRWREWWEWSLPTAKRGDFRLPVHPRE
jgi:hypothetical protein